MISAGGTYLLKPGMAMLHVLVLNSRHLYPDGCIWLMGCGSFCAGKWLQWKWPNEWLLSNIMANEMVPLYLDVHCGVVSWLST